MRFPVTLLSMAAIVVASHAMPARLGGHNDIERTPSLESMKRDDPTIGHTHGTVRRDDPVIGHTHGTEKRDDPVIGYTHPK
ncbi:hypothetical protein DENSPDRAFT_832004 [Dentipellis sp. KUC8613]|nr:hypothetical protein DENSPDRAFT_832004 [Dentipellis sp. KUC8613]